MATFKENLRQLRKENNLTQREVASKIALLETTYQSYEAGRTEPPIEIIIKLADIFECSVDYLLGRASELDVVNIQTDLTEQQKELLQNFDKLNVEGKARLMGYLLALMSMPAFARR